MKIEPVAGVGLDIGREVICPNKGEAGCYASRDGGNFGIARCKAVAAAVREVVRCVRNQHQLWRQLKMAAERDRCDE